jgi:mannose-6-phosphate isomerase-like protein (cupin superfamily)
MNNRNRQVYRNERVIDPNDRISLIQFGRPKVREDAPEDAELGRVNLFEAASQLRESANVIEKSVLYDTNNLRIEVAAVREGKNEPHFGWLVNETHDKTIVVLSRNISIQFAAEGRVITLRTGEMLVIPRGVPHVISGPLKEIGLEPNHERAIVQIIETTPNRTQ